MSRPGTGPTPDRASPSSGSTHRSSPSSTCCPTCVRLHRNSACTIPSPSTITTPPGTPTRTSTGRPSTSSTPTATSATSTSGKAATGRPRPSSARCSRRPTRRSYCRPRTDVPNTTPTEQTTPESYLGYDHPSDLFDSSVDENQMAPYQLPSSLPATSMPTVASGQSGARPRPQGRVPPSSSASRPRTSIW